MALYYRAISVKYVAYEYVIAYFRVSKLPDEEILLGAGGVATLSTMSKTTYKSFNIQVFLRIEFPINPSVLVS